jgi:rSAM/selenodomain-associated transferase 1
MTAGMQVVVIAKAPVPGRVKTRLCPPCTPQEAAEVAAASLADTIATLTAAPALARTLAVDGELAAPAGWRTVPQRGGGLDERLTAAYADTALPGVPTLLVGMDTPQLTVGHVTAAAEALRTADAALGQAEDGGWWGLALRDPGSDGALLTGVPMSTSDTARWTLEALRSNGRRVALLPVLRDVDTADDARAVAAMCPGTRFHRAVASNVRLS